MKTSTKVKGGRTLAKSSEIVAKKKFEDFIIKGNHPCIMAQTVFSMDSVDFHTYKNFGSQNAAGKILKDLRNYLADYNFDSNEFFTFIAAFPGRKNFTEEQFEKLLWKQLNFLHEIDEEPWDPEVSNNPADKNFSFSLAGKAFYMVGMHPNSSREARKSPFPAIVFNLHWQFERLREMGSYDTVRDKIRERDIELQGSINPMLANFGERSEAPQYSGRKVGEEWKCPFLSGKI